MENASEEAIGIFDSGIGGLTVAHAIKHILPNERLIYFGDTAHLPYGDKSPAAVQAYSIKITDLLIKRGCKVIVIACNTASSVANELLKEYTASRAKVINVVDPMVVKVAESTSSDKIGVIGTKGTIASGIYKHKLMELKPNLRVEEVPTPLLVPMIEEYRLSDQSPLLSGDRGDEKFLFEMVEKRHLPLLLFGAGHVARALVKELYKTENRYTCPHGRPIVKRFTWKELRGFFKRQ